MGKIVNGALIFAGGFAVGGIVTLNKMIQNENIREGFKKTIIDVTEQALFGAEPRSSSYRKHITYC